MKLSIIIATKDRHDCLKKCIDGLQYYLNREDCEIIIHDNSYDRNKSYSLKRSWEVLGNLHYYIFEEDISQVANYELATSYASGQFVTMIGDDDGICEGLIEVVDFMEINKVDAILGQFAVYLWPGVGSTTLRASNGLLQIPKYTGQIIKLDANIERLKCLNVGGTSLEKLPRMYYGILNKNVLNKVKKYAGVFFPGPSPDMANAFSASYFVNKFYYLDYPIFIAGNSTKSAAGMNFSRKHVGEIKDIPFLPKDCNSKWSNLIPRFWSGPTIWAQSVYESSSILNGSDDFIKDFNFIYLYARCSVFNFKYKSRIWKAFRSYTSKLGRFSILDISIFFFNIAKIWLSRLFSLVKNLQVRVKYQIFKNKGVDIESNLLDVAEATIWLQKNLDRSVIKFAIKNR